MMHTGLVRSGSDAGWVRIPTSGTSQSIMTGFSFTLYLLEDAREATQTLAREPLQMNGRGAQPV
jgi:hypothetical protein